MSDLNEINENNTNRRIALRAIADLTVEHNLPVPMSIDISSHWPSLKLRLDDNDREGVRRWGEALGLDPVTEVPVGTGSTAFISVHADNLTVSGYEHPVRLRFENVEVWSACDRQRGGEQS
jgi:hypothetical protein